MTDNTYINELAIGAMGGNLVKFYNGEMSYYAPYGYSITSDWESGPSSLNSWSTINYGEPAYVHVDNRYVYNNGPAWILDQVEE